jgi:hypothetical protein
MMSFLVEGIMRFYHGGPHAVTHIDADQFGADGELLCASASPNVARRYGEVVSVFDLATDKVVRASVSDWFRGNCPDIEQLRKDGVHAVVVDGNAGIFDFPVDTVFVIAPEALDFRQVLSHEELAAIDDGRSIVHDPQGPGDREWDLYASNHVDEDAEPGLPSASGAKYASPS